MLRQSRKIPKRPSGGTRLLFRRLHMHISPIGMSPLSVRRWRAMFSGIIENGADTMNTISFASRHDSGTGIKMLLYNSCGAAGHVRFSGR